MRIPELVLTAAGVTVIFLVAACSNVEPSATPAAGVTVMAQVNRNLATLIQRPTAQPKDTARRPWQTATPRPSLTPTATTQEIFNLLNRGKLTPEEAAAELNRRNQEGPGAFTPSPVATSAQSSALTLLPASTPVFAQPPNRRGSAQWISQLEAEVHALVNHQRIKSSLTSLTHDSTLADVARTHSEDMVINEFFAHDNLNGQGPSDRANAAGYSCINQGYVGIAENIFKGWLFSAIMTFGTTSIKAYMDLYELARVVVDGWMDSPGHRQNILTARYNKEGIGVDINPETEAVLVTQNLC